MNRAQGNTRQAPDGFLHIQNFTVTKHAGIAAVVWSHAFDDHQKGIVESLLIELACSNPVGDVHHFKHGAWRFRKEFLKVNFEWAVFKLAQAIKLDPASMLYQAVLRRDRAINKD